MKIWFLKIIKNPLFLAFVLLLLFMYFAYSIFKDKETVLAAISTGLVVMFGYFATHYFTIMRDQREKKLQLCLEFIKKLRFFIIEEHIKGDRQQNMRDELQDAYFPFSLLISSASYEALSKMMQALDVMLKNKTKLKEFKDAQSDFVNNLRNEFFIDSKIKFETYDIRLEQDNPKS
ncbi:MAG: hypothetical protein NTZ42_01920 [Candidatus Gribaldobacteria bacterium]|nr:hypothetical protein [Candidatus Gribaldobacteria bacterium]